MTKRINIQFVVVLLAIGLATALQIRGQQQPRKDTPMTHEATQEMNQRGDKVMGFDHTKTTHHFLLRDDGGVIQVEANEVNDKESSEQIRRHLRHITMMFSDGNFAA